MTQDESEQEPSKLFRRQLPTWFPEQTTADACLGLLADFVTQSHELGPSRWVLTLRDRAVLTLNVGAWLVLRFSDDGSACVALDTAVLGGRPEDVLGDASVRTREPFSRAPHVFLVDLPSTALATLLPKLQPALRSALARAARQGTPFARYHSPEALGALADAVGRTLPSPDYRALGGASAAPSETPAGPDRWTDASLQQAWARQVAQRSEWTENAFALVAKMRAVTAAQFRAREVQHALWNTQAFASAGPGHAIDVSAAWQDEDVLARLDTLRSRTWDADVAAQAAAIQHEFDEVMARLIALGVKSRPWAKLLRVFSILLPQHLTCLLQHDARVKAVRRLFGRDHAASAIEEQVKIRARLREALGEETELREHVQRITFCWSLQNPPPAVEIEAKGAVGNTDSVPTNEGATEPPALPALALWPFSRQYKGIPALKRYTEAWRDLLRAAQAGQTTDAIVDEVRAAGAASEDSSKALRYAVSRLLGLGMLTREGDLFRLSEAGTRVLDGEDDPLVEQLLVRTYGFARLLRVIAAGARVTRAALYSALRAEYPSWTSNFGPSALLAWAKDLGLVTEADNLLSLDPYGVAWHARLPEQLPTPDASDPTIEGVDEVVTAVADARLVMPPFETIDRHLRAHESAQGFVIEPAMLRALHAGWTCTPTKHFVILSGLSGTGKTAVLRHYARAVCAALGLPEARHVQLVAVSPDWHDPSGLLGYFNPLHEDPTYQIEPALRLVLDAASDPSKPYFLVLDEMNLARVERYMAPFLSAMETGGALALHASAVDVNGVPPRVRWPSNLFLGGTVNMDESTHPFSDKVLDRAFTLEFWSVDLEAFFARRAARDATTEAALRALNDALAPARRHFGYRTAGEVIDFVRAMADAGADAREALDQAVFAKVLPKLRGEDDAPLRAALEAAQKVAEGHGLRRSADKLALMRRRLADTGVTRFWS